MQTRIARKLLNFDLLIFLAITGIFILNSCRSKDKSKHTETQRPTKIRSKVISLNAKEDDLHSIGDSISFFDLDLTEANKGDTVGFVSVSDIDALPASFNSSADSVDRLVIPNLENKKPEETRYLILSSKYRKRLLAGTGISETDSLFVYDYANDILLKFPISSLDAVASLSIYKDAPEAAHAARDYQFGFQIDRASLSALSGKYFGNTLVYIGRSDPFARGQMRPVIWEKIDAKKVPSIELKADDAAALKEYKFSNAYHFASDGFNYYLQEYLNNENKEYSTKSFRMLIINAANEVISNSLDYETESSSPAPISVAGNNKNELIQWTGRLLKKKPPLIVGLDYIEFGCPILPFIDKSNKYVPVYCDNRH